ncbi:hypothetical protein HZA57_07800 [Candidatus Poribacteria bacterium]|nr:hypothetical protein [Candidatus Poribacteria bacterium]
MPMPSTTEILVGMTRQMYEDIKFIAEQNPTQVVDDETAYVYNQLLNDVRTNFPGVPMVFAFKDMSPRTLKYKDALVMAGQMACLLNQMQRPAAPSTGQFKAPGPAQTASRQAVPRTSEPAGSRAEKDSDTRHDHELYGPRPPSRVNDDGTVPFSLLDEEEL